MLQQGILRELLLQSLSDFLDDQEEAAQVYGVISNEV